MAAGFTNIYEQLSQTELAECGGTGTIYRHKKTGARIFCISCPDPNKVFMIGFRTTPKDSTGVAHIMEHSVLCGSQKFPLKDPFVELAKGSLNTFLNAMTYPDKTVYPVASCNEKDFMNLMDVYLDAVLHSNIYRERKIFEQEGWHYELAAPDAPLSINGVVYNEMKGVFSNPESVLERYTMHALFPDTTYGFESGGDPDVIPQLSYEEFLAFHSRYYHPSNSYIYLYGDMDMEEKLLWIDEHYLSAYDRLEIDSRILPETPFAKPREETVAYAIGDTEPEEGRAWLSANFVVGGELDAERYLAWQILEFALIDAPGAPLKEALIKAGIGEDILGGYTQGILQPYFSVIAKHASLKDRVRFAGVVHDCIAKLTAEGMDKKSLLAALNYTEFKYREADYGRMPAGLMYGLTALDTWLYDGDPTLHLRYDETFRSLRAHLEDGYFEELLKSAFLDNPFSADVAIVPKRGLQAEREEKEKERLAAYLSKLSAADKEKIVQETKELKAYQSEPADEDALNTLPVLGISDISREAEKVRIKRTGDVLYSELETHGIAYMRILLDTAALTEEELQFASFLTGLYGEIDTKAHSYKDLSSEILLRTGGISFDLVSYPQMDGSGAFCGRLVSEIRSLSAEVDAGLSMAVEMLTETLLEDEERIGEKLAEAKSRMQMKLDGASHSAAVCRAGSYYNRVQRFDDLTGGIAYYDFLNAALRFYQEPVHRKRWLKSLSAVAKKLIASSEPLFALSGSAEEKAAMEAALPKIREQLSKTSDAAKKEAEESGKPLGIPTGHPVQVQGCLNEGFETSGQVNYVARCGSFLAAGPYTGALQVLKGMLNYDYLWTNLRVKGGAYGCMSGFARSGRAFLVSYRDPNVAETNSIYEALPDCLAHHSFSEIELRKYIIGAVADLDQPVTPAISASREVSKYLSGLTDADFQKEWDEILSCTGADLNALAPYMRALLDAHVICAIGSKGKIEADKELFRSVRPLYS